MAEKKSSGFSGGVPDFFTAGRRSTVVPTNMNIQQQGSFSSPLSGNPSDPTAQILARRGPDSMPMGKRSLAEFQQQQKFLQQQQGLEFYLRNVKPRYGYRHTSPISTLSTVDFPPGSMEISSVSNPMINNVNPRCGLPILKQQRPQSSFLSNTGHVSTGIFLPNLVSNKASMDSVPGQDFSAQESEKKILNHKLQELEKLLLGDEGDAEEASTVTTTDWSETMLNLINPARKPISPSPTSSSSSCSSTAASPLLPCPKQYLIDAAVAISERKPEIASEVFSRLQHLTNERSTSEQRLAVYMVSALKSRAIGHPPPPVSELYGEEHYLATQLLYDVLPCFKLGLMAANLAILAAASERSLNKIHVVDFDIGQGVQYVHLIHALANEGKPSAMLKITTFTDSSTSAVAEKLKYVGDMLKSLANKKGVCFSIRIKNSSTKELSRENLEVQSDEALAVNFAFKLYKIPDESVSTENQRDDLLRRVKMLSPAVMTVVEQEMNTNTAPLVARVREVCDHYGSLLDSLDATVPRENPSRVRIEEGLCRRMKNSVACEGRDRVERCEVFGKWRARFGMSGFKIRPTSQPVVDSLRSKLHCGRRGNPGFTVNEESGGVSFGWMGRTLSVASAWY